MKLYYFVKEKHGMENIRRRRLKVSRFSDLNDPFEMLGADPGSPEARRFLNQAKIEAADSMGIICFSRTWHNPLMWSHYADRHRGMCLELDVADNLAQPVNYVAERVPVPDDISPEFLQQLALTKSIHWNHEEEYRAFLKIHPPARPIEFQPFEARMRLTGVLVGANSTASRSEIKAALGNLAPHVRAVKTRGAFRTFRVVENLDESRWV